MNSLFARARPEAPGPLARLDSQHHSVASHLGCRPFSKDHDRHTPTSEGVTRRVDHVLHAVDRSYWRGKARTLAPLAEPAFGGVLRKYGVDDGDWSSNRES